MLTFSQSSHANTFTNNDNAKVANQDNQIYGGQTNSLN